MVEQQTADSLFLSKLIDIIHANLADEKFGVKDLARESGMSRYGLSRKLKEITKKTTIQFISEVRLNKALEMLQKENNTASEVAYRLGFGSPAYFSKRFHEFFGYPPGEAKKREAILSDPNVAAKRVFEDKVQVRWLGSKILTTLLIIALITVVLGILFYKNSNKSRLTDKILSSGGRISIAVMPFCNLTNNNNWDVWQEGIQNELITSLTNSEELKVRQTESTNSLIQLKGPTNYAFMTPSVASSVSRKLDTHVFVYGTIKQAGATVRLNAQLIDSKTEEVFKAFQIDGTADSILNIISSLSAQINNFLIITILKKKVSPAFQDFLGSTKYPEALSNFINGQKAYSKLDFTSAIRYYSQAIAIDSDYISPYIFKWFAFKNNGQPVEARNWSLKVFAKRDLMTYIQQCYTNHIYASCYGTPNESVRYYKEIIDFDDLLPDAHNDLGSIYCYLRQYDKAIPEFKRTLEIYDKWGVKPFWSSYYSWLALAYHKTGQYKKEKKLLSRAEKDFPDDSEIMYWQIVLSLTERDSASAKLIIKKWTFAKMVQSWSEARITASYANMYIDGGIPDEAEKYVRQALIMEPDNPARMRDLAYFLIDNDRNLNEGMELIDKALELNPDEAIALECKGLGLYKQGKFQEALVLLQKSWDLRLWYRHSLYLHLEEAKKAVAAAN